MTLCKNPASTVIYHDDKLNLVPVSDARQCYNRYKHMLTDAEREWYENFLKGNFRGNEDALKAIGVGTKKRREILAERSHASNAQRRGKQNDRTRGSGYSSNDYIAAETSPESAMVTALDIGKKPDSE